MWANGWRCCAQQLECRVPEWQRINGDLNHIHVGYGPRAFVADPLNASPYDGGTMVMVGNDLNTTVAVVLPVEAFGRTPQIRCKDIATITGPNGHGAAPPVFRGGPWPHGEPNATQLRARRAFLLPARLSNDLLTTQPSGCYTLLAFYTTFLRPELESGVT